VHSTFTAANEIRPGKDKKSASDNKKKRRGSKKERPRQQK